MTGVVNLHFRGFLQPEVWSSAAFWGSGVGQALAWKLGSVVVMIGISAVHDFVLGPAASHLQAGSPEAMAARRRASWLARANALVGIVLVAAAVRLARGG